MRDDYANNDHKAQEELEEILSEYLASKFNVTELKSMLKQRGLPVSERKSVLISRLVQTDPEGMKEIVIEDYLAYKFKITELRSMLKQCGLPVSGRKSDLISRLIQADPEGMWKAIIGEVSPPKRFRKDRRKGRKKRKGTIGLAIAVTIGLTPIALGLMGVFGALINQ